MCENTDFIKQAKRNFPELTFTEDPLTQDVMVEITLGTHIRHELICDKRYTEIAKILTHFVKAVR